jgi:PAS domain S-box-containing protein
LNASQGVASTLNLEGSLRPVLESALINGATASRVVLEPSVVPDLNSDLTHSRSFGYGPSAESYAALDDQILALVKQKDVVKLTSLTHPRILTVQPGTPRPESILAVALRHENLFFGALWNAYHQPHQFGEEEIRYMTTLAGQAALATANARLFLTAEIGRLRLEAILIANPDPILVTDQNDNLLLTNPAARHLININTNNSIGKPVDEVIAEKSLVALLKAKSTDQQSAEISFPGGAVYFATATTMLRDNKRVGHVCILRDVTTFKRLDTMKSEFVSTVSHDLRSPLTLIQGYASMLPIVGDLNDQQSNYLRKINVETEKITRLVNSVLNLSRIESGTGLQLEKRPIPEIFERVINSLQARAAQKRIRLVTGGDNDALQVIEADQDLLHQAMFNLVENAIKFSAAESEILLSAKLDQDQVTFVIQDHGIGIAPTDQRRIFEKFYHTSQKGAEFDAGSGLGLAIAKSIVDRHGGKIWVESKLGQGSTFYFTLPVNHAQPTP